MSTPRHLLVVDDDPEITELLHDFLARQGFRVSTAADGAAMRRLMESWDFDLVILDVMLPGEDGLSLCRDLRGKSNIPIIMLTAASEETDRIVGLEVGADDYLIKPFSPRELLARIRALFRRAAPEAGGPAPSAQPRTRTFRFAGWTLDEGSRELRSPDKVLVPLSGGEFALLMVFLTHPRTVLDREALLDGTRGVMPVPFDRSIDVQVSRLRRKIEADAKEPALIKTVRGQGYLLACTVDESW